jgi:hypothetical protein
MAISQTVVRLAGGIVVALFSYQSDMDLYRLTITEGTAFVIRDGAEITIDKTDGGFTILSDVASALCHSNMCHFVM